MDCSKGWLGGKNVDALKGVEARLGSRGDMVFETKLVVSIYRILLSLQHH